MKTATCLCGKVSIEVIDVHSEVGACHCLMCRKWGSGPLLTVEAGTAKDIRIHSEDLVSRYKSSEWAERGFCSNCGSNLFTICCQRMHTVFPLICSMICQMLL